MKVVILGAGLMGRAIAYDMTQNSDVKQIILADKDFDRAVQVAKLFSNKVLPIKFDANDLVESSKLMQNCCIAISAIPYFCNFGLAKAAIEAATAGRIDLPEPDECGSSAGGQGRGAVERLPPLQSAAA